MVSVEYSNHGNLLEIQISKEKFQAEIVEKPFYDPHKKITKT
jgi:glycine cleavage system aminomethyltransferase T